MLNGNTWTRHHKTGRWKNKNIVIFLFIFISSILAGACVNHLPAPGSTLTSTELEDFKKTPSDADIMHDGFKYLGSIKQPHDYARAKASFEQLSKSYPDSRWRNLAESLIMLIDNMKEFQENNRQCVEDKTSLLQENEKLKRDVKNMLEKLNTETARLTQENEQMKKDIQLLKNLEVQIEKRERILR